MKRITLISCLMLYGLITFAQSNKCDSIVWKADRKLTWDDFKGQPVASGQVAAKTHNDFVRTWSAHGYTLKTRMVNSFNPCLSWSRNKRSDTLLAHEQGHFDIAEYFRRLYYKRVAEGTYTPATITSVLKKIYRDINTECEAMQEAYDTETVHSLKRDKQAEWLEKIAALLSSVKEYDKEEMVVDLPHS